MDQSRDMPPCARLKVGHACYPCRTKKIKCDGIRPCMQCKARGRTCTFTKDGQVDTGREGSEESDEAKDHEKPDSVDILLFSITPSIDHQHNYESITSHEMTFRAKALQAKELNNPNHASFISRNAPENHLSHLDLFGGFITWSPEPLLPSKYASISMPSTQVQLRLIDNFFTDRYEILPILPKHYFYHQLSLKGPLITPFLLNTIYMTSSKFMTGLDDDCTPDLFYDRARRLLDDFMDTPRVSTVIGLILLSLYEPKPSLKQNRPSHCRAWMYSGMASRMCLELGLNSEKNIDRDLQSQDVEMRRRVFWGCFYLDKYQSSAWQRPWMICSTVAQISLPRCLDEEDEDTARIIQGLGIKINLGLLCEASIKLRASVGSMAGQRSSFASIEAQFRDHYCKLVNWLQILPLSMQWTAPLVVDNRTVTAEDIDGLDFKGALISDLHLVYNINLLDCLLSMNEDPVIRYHRFITAAHLTQLVRQLSLHPEKVMKFEMVGHAAIMAIKTHGYYLYDSNVEMARKAWIMYDQCIVALFALQKYAVIPNCDKVLEHFSALESEYTRESSRNNTPTLLTHDPVWDFDQGRTDICSQEPLRQSSSCQTGSFGVARPNHSNARRRPVSEPWGITGSNSLQSTPVVPSQQSSSAHSPDLSIMTRERGLFGANASLNTPLYETHSGILNNQLPISANFSSPYSLTSLDPTTYSSYPS
ncbi:fungal-specific transcription factor domain-containing protein [Phycomyces nitens]|nr:fungal-specific transcription factor domain-containing protein [Phycomyces nitens]